MKKFMGAIFALLMSLGLVAVAATPAQAAVCAPGEFCISKQYGLDPYFRKTPPQAPQGQCITLPVQDYTRYVENRTQYDWWVYLTGSCSGTRATMQSYTSGPMNANWSDRIRSVIRLPHDDGFSATSPVQEGKSVPIDSEIIWTKNKSVPISYNETVLPPRGCANQDQECLKAKKAWDEKRAAKLAAAADWEGQCATTTGIMCPYEWSDGLFPMDTLPGGLARNTCTPIKLNGVDSKEASSFWNRTTTRWWVFRTSTCGGSHKDIPPNTKIVDAYEVWGFGWDGPGWIMRTSSTT